MEVFYLYQITVIYFLLNRYYGIHCNVVLGGLSNMIEVFLMVSISYR